MEKIALGARIILGLIFTIFGLNGFFNFIPMPEMTPEAGAFMGGLAGSGYFFPFLKITEILCGLLLLIGVYVPLALTVLAPIILNILFFHIFLDNAGLPMALILVILEGYLGFFGYKEHLKCIYTCPRLEAKKRAVTEASK